MAVFFFCFILKAAGELHTFFWKKKLFDLGG
jgi:hypothetical protein